MLTDSKRMRFICMVFSLLCALAIGVCLICNIAVAKKISWAFYVLASVPFFWLVGSALILVRKHRIICAVGVWTLCVFPFLYILSKITAVTGWFSPLAVPIGITAILAVWISMALMKFLKINLWYRAASIAFIFGIVAYTVIQYIARSFVGSEFLTLDLFINLFSYGAGVVLLAIVGYYSANLKKIKQEHEE